MEIIVLGLFVIVALGVVVIMFTELLNFVQTHVPFVPTAKKDLIDMIARAGITREDLVYDLGSGNGKVVFTVEQLTGARAKGFQRGGWTQWYAQLRKRLTGSKIEFVTGNFFDNSWSDATVIYAYLYPFLMRSVEEKALEDCRPGTKIIIRDFNLPTLSHADKWQTPTGHTMYLYVI